MLEAVHPKINGNTLVLVVCENRLNNDLFTVITLQSGDKIIHREKTGKSRSVSRPPIYAREINNADSQLILRLNRRGLTRFS